MESLTSGFFLGCEDPGHRDAPSRSRDHSQARGRPPSPPQGPPPPSHVSTLKTTEEKKGLYYTLVSIYVNLEREMAPTYHFNFYARWQTDLGLANMELNHPQCWVIACPSIAIFSL